MTYPQTESWACGPHSTGRALIIVGKMRPEDLPGYVHKSPVTTGVPNVEWSAIGPYPSTLNKYAKPDYFCEYFDWNVLMAWVKGQSPVVVLTRAENDGNLSDVILHYQVAVGTDKGEQKVLILDTNNSLKEYSREFFTKMAKTWIGSAMLVFTKHPKKPHVSKDVSDAHKKKMRKARSKKYPLCV